MLRFHTNIRTKLMLMGVGSILVTVLALVVVGSYEINVFNAQAKEEVNHLIDDDLDHITEGVYNLIKAQDEAVQQKVSYDLNVARFILNNWGKVQLSDEQVTWSAVNQYTKKEYQIELPKMLVGGTWLGQNTDSGVETPVVDQVQELVGGTATIFQRMNEQGDILRVATNVKKQDGARAIGTYIPAVNPDGTPNPVVSTVMRGETYHGIAYVVNAWYVTAYEPIYDEAGLIIGVLYVGVKQENVESLRQAILRTRVGDSGYVYILGGKGDDQGHYIISKDGKRDGEDIWRAQDAEGRYYIQSIVQKAVALQPGEFATERYPWQNAGEPEPRWKVARIAYYEPWDWVIGAGAYEDDYQDYWDHLQTGQSRMILTLAVLGIGIAVLGGLATWLFAKSIAVPLNQVARVADALSAGDVTQEVTHQSGDEVGALAAAFRRMIAYQNSMAVAADHLAQGDLRADVRPHSDKDVLGIAFSQMVANLQHLVGQVTDSASNLGTASGQLAASAEQAGQVTSQIAATIQQVAQGIAQQAEGVTKTAATVEHVSRAIEGVAQGAQEQAAAVARSADMTGQITAAIQQVSANAQAGVRGAVQAAQIARSGVQTVDQTIQGIAAIKDKVGLSAQKMQEMGERSEQIGAIVEVIDDIASQTNLLALNAAIEAARASAQAQGLTRQLLDYHMVAHAQFVAELLTMGKRDWSPRFWAELARRTGIDVFTVTDADGVVVFSNEAGKLGFRFPDDPGSQAYVFRQLLHGTDGVVCQEAQRRTVDDQFFKFVGVSRRDQRGIVQVGLRLDRVVKFRFQVGGFAVVADEVRKLAEKAAAATKEIATLIQAIQGTIREAVVAMDEGTAEVEAGASRADEAGQALAGILQAVEAVTQQVEEISAATQQMSASADEVTSAMETVSAVVEENTAATEEMAAGSDEVTQAIEGIARVSEDLRSSTGEVNAAAEEMNAQVEEVAASAQALSEMAEELQALVVQFTLSKDDSEQAEELVATQAPTPLVTSEGYHPELAEDGDGYQCQRLVPTPNRATTRVHPYS